MGKTPAKKLVFIIDEYGRTPSKSFLDRLMAELLDKVFIEPNIDVTVANGRGINTCKYLAEQIIGKDIVTWEIVYLHGSIYPPVLLAHGNKENLIVLLPKFSGTSAEAVYKVLNDSGAFSQFAA